MSMQLLRTTCVHKGKILVVEGSHCSNRTVYFKCGYATGHRIAEPPMHGVVATCVQREMSQHVYKV
jgi:hypothetical protein